MKKLFIVLLSVLMTFSAGAKAAEIPEAPQVLITGYEAENNCVQAGGKTKLTVKLMNMSRSQTVNNVSFSFSDNSGVLSVAGVDTAYAETLAPRGEFQWTFYVYASPDAAGGEYTSRINAEYDTSGGRSSSGGSISLTVKEKKEELPDNSAVRLAVSSCEVENGGAYPGEKRLLTLKLKNMSLTKSAVNVYLKLTDPSGDITPENFGAAYPGSIAPGGVYEWKISLEAAFSAEVGRHILHFSAEYEDGSGNSFSVSEELPVDVIQTVKLEYDNALLPTKCIQGDTVSINLNLMNTGKSDVVNCRACCEADGLISGGTVFAGEIKAGENASVGINLRADNEKLGETEGTLTVLYDDVYGKSHSFIVPVSTVIAEKTAETEEEEQQSPVGTLWWLFLAGGFILGGIAGAVMSGIIMSSKQRKLDEARL